MIPRYTRPVMSTIWSDEHRYRLMVTVEVLAARAMAELGVIPQEAMRPIAKAVTVDPARVATIERETRHDVIAFLTAMGEVVGAEGRYLHQGMTSSDLLDTVLALQMRASLDLVLSGLDAVLAVLRERALEHRDTVCMGRSHGIYAEPTTFGLKLLGHHQAFARQRERLGEARATIAVGAISGPVGTYAAVDPRVEERVMAWLNLKVEPVSTQIIPRDRHAAVVGVLAGLASSIDNLAVEVRHLHRSEVGEVQEPFGKGQKGSSAMPHKKILCWRKIFPVWLE